MSGHCGQYREEVFIPLSATNAEIDPNTSGVSSLEATVLGAESRLNGAAMLSSTELV